MDRPSPVPPADPWRIGSPIPLVPPPIPGSGKPESPTLPGCCARIELNGRRGTAWLAEPDRFVTVAHLVQSVGESGRVTVRFRGEALEARVEALDTAADVAVLRVDRPLGVQPLAVADTERPAGRWLGFSWLDGDHGVYLGGSVTSVATVDAFGSPRISVTGREFIDRMRDPDHGLSGAPIVVGDHVVGHISTYVPHPDSIDRPFSSLVYGATLSGIRALLGRSAPAPRDAPTAPGPAPLSVGEQFHAFVLFRSTDREFAGRLMTRLEGSGLEVLPAQHEDPAAPLLPDERRAWEASRDGLVVFSRAWLSLGTDRLRAVADTLASVASASTRRIILLNVDDTPVPEPLSEFREVRFRGAEPDHGTVLRSLQLAYPPEGQEAALEASLVLESVRDDAVLEVNDARGVAKRIAFVAKRWKESGVPGCNVPVLAATYLVEAGRADLAIEALRGVPRTIRMRQAEATALHALGRTNELLEVLETLSAAAVSDASTGRLAGGVWTRQWESGGRQRKPWLHRAWHAYLDTWRRSGDAESGAWAAALALRHDGHGRARELAGEVRRELEARLSDPSSWESAAHGVACLILGDLAGARDSLARAAGLEDELDGLARVREAVRLVVGRLPDLGSDGATASIDEVLQLPAVALFVADRTHDWESWRPAASRAEEEHGLRRIRESLDTFDVGFGVSGLTSEADLLFAEAVLERRGAVEIVLPFERDAFLDMWIAPRLRSRVDRLLAEPRVQVETNRQTVPDSVGVAAAIAAAAAEIERRARERAHRWGRRPLRIEVGGDGADGEGVDDVWRVARLDEWRPDRPAPAKRPDPEGPEAGDADEFRAMRRKGRPPTQEPMTYRKRFLVAVGIDRYREWNPLSNAANDARAVMETLEQSFGFDGRLILDEEATADRIRDAITKTLTPQVQKEDLVVFFFAGHGHSERADDGEEHGFLVPVEATRTGTGDLLPMEEVVSWTRAMACDDVLYIFDSCFSGFAGLAGGETERGGVFDARLAITAGTTEQRVLDAGAPEGFSGHSVFTGWLLRGLTEDLPTGKLDPVNALSLYLYLQRVVAEATQGKETPSCGFLHGHGIGNIWLQIMTGDPQRSG
ncbi:MAG: caspase family protein [Gemmatimonadota bacterium]